MGQIKRAGLRPAPTTPVLFCDFDGTITLKGMVDEVGEVFVGETWLALKQKMLERKLSLLEGVAMAFETIPSSRREEIIDHVKQAAKIRPGFMELLDYCKVGGIPFIVVSGGVDFFMEPVLKPYVRSISRAYSLESDFSHKNLRLVHKYSCGECGLCKLKVMEEYPGRTRILIGDGLTDLHGAQHADLVFARASLAKYLDQEGRPYLPYETFFDVIHGLNDFLKVGTKAEKSS
jgi:2-hydroxy-3-keto-5-methylthiopentenyl-1-phosphate phosphatase